MQENLRIPTKCQAKKDSLYLKTYVIDSQIQSPNWRKEYLAKQKGKVTQIWHTNETHKIAKEQKVAYMNGLEWLVF